MSTQRRLRVEADGGSRGNPGVAGYGALIRDEATGEVLAERAQPLGLASNNVAEYSGLLAGLRAVLAIDRAAAVTVAMDSKLVVEQMSGRWKIKHEDMRRLALEARDLVAQITAAGGHVRYTWIPRAANGDADKLSNDGMDGLDICRGAGCADEEPPIVAFAHPTDPFPKGEPTRLVLVRHGVTALTEQMRLDGRGGLDPSLSELGREQGANAARLVAELLAGHPAPVVTSALARAKETGALIAAALGVEAQVDDAWDEQNFGDWDGAAMADLLTTQRADVGHLRADPRYKRPGGESHLDLTARVLAAYEELVGRGGTTVVVCHRKPIMVVLAHVLGLTMERGWRVETAPGSMSGVEAWTNGVATIAFTNRT